MVRRSLIVIGLTLWTASSAAFSLQLVSVEQEIAIGKEAQQQVREQVPEVTDAAILNYIRGLGQQITAQADGPKYPYSFDVANYKEINAFALPGGPVWINRGTIAAAQNEAQLASVVAHEVAHIARRHHGSQLTRTVAASLGLGLLGALLGEGAGAQVAQIGAQVAAGATMARFSRDAEREADLAGLQYMHRAGYDPRAAAEFMQILRQQAGRDPSSIEVFLASHPAPAERVERLQAEAARLGHQGRRDSQAFQSTRARLDRLGPAESMQKGR